jgi:hypothetical protein
MKWVCAKCNPSCHLLVSEDVTPTDCPYGQSFINTNQDSTANWQKEKSSGKKAAKKRATPTRKSPAPRAPKIEQNTVAGFRLL